MSDLKSKDRCVGVYPALWRFNYTHNVPVRTSIGATGDTEFSHMELMHGQFDVVADDESFAIVTFLAKRPANIYTRTSGPEKLCYVDAITQTS